MVEFQTAWGWQPALYLFLGGLAAGTFVVSGMIKLLGKGEHRAVSCAGMWAALICLAAGLVVLILDVSQPLRALMMWQSFSHPTSWMAIGAWLLFLTAVVFAVSAVLGTDALVDRFTAARAASGADGDLGEEAGLPAEGAPGTVSAETKRTVDTVARVFTVAGIVLGACVAVYTGILLANAVGIAFWNNWLLPVLFTVSALDTGVALVSIVVTVRKGESGAAKLHAVLERATLVLVLVEAVALAALLLTSRSTTAAASAAALTSGFLAVPFWALVVAIGLVVPLVVAIVSLASKKVSVGRAGFVVGACGALVGGCTLRFVIVFAGAHFVMAQHLLSILL